MNNNNDVDDDDDNNSNNNGSSRNINLVQPARIVKLLAD